MNFVKMHGLGNDFIIIQKPTWEEALLLQPHAKKLCDRRLGIGADGLVVTGKGTGTDLFMRVFNPDGTEAEMCGNAIRCIALYAVEKGLVEKNTLSVQTLAGVKYPEIIESAENTFIRVDMGEPVLERSKVPVKGEGSNMGIDIATDLGSFKFTAVSMGNPHCVIVVEQDIGTINIEKIGPLIETHELFPDKTNVEFVNIINEREIAMRVWERGAGITLACGTGACAVLAAAVQNGLTQREALIHLPGGDLIIEWKAADNHIYMTGPAEFVFTGEIDLSRINLRR